MIIKTKMTEEEKELFNKISELSDEFVLKIRSEYVKRVRKARLLGPKGEDEKRKVNERARKRKIKKKAKN